MRINIKLNDMSYRYDVYQIFNIYYGSRGIKFEEPYNYYVNIDENSVNCRFEGKVQDYKFDGELTKKENLRIAVFSFLKELTKKEYPWGTLIGIRPSKIALKLLENHTDEEVEAYFAKHSITGLDKTRLCMEVARAERKYVRNDKNTISVYVGMPFCPTKCLYCSFASNSIASKGNMVDKYIDTLIYELDKTKEYIMEKALKIQCIYFGGGTPTSVSEVQFEKIMKKIYDNFIECNDVKEFTVECGRPDSITLNKLETMKRYKVHRISINPQTMNEKTLKLIGRNHTPKDITEKFKLARSLGFDNINMDLIVGLPLESLEDVKNTCREVYKLKPDNLTVHGLSIKRGSRLYETLVNKGIEWETDQQEIIEMFNCTRKLSESLDMAPYYMYRQKNMVGNMENVGYSIPGTEGIYNIQMIEESQTIIACGADAVTKVMFPEENRIERAANLKEVREYITRIDELINKKTELLNTLFNNMEMEDLI